MMMMYVSIKISRQATSLWKTEGDDDDDDDALCTVQPVIS